MARKLEDILSSLPVKLVNRLMPFQKEGILFAVSKHGRCLIADEMGLGKTIQAISIAYYYKSEWPLLIIVPSSLRFSWVEEIEKWIPDIHPSDIFLLQTGNDSSGIKEAKICITTFGLLCKSTSRVILEALNSQKFQVVIVDESHYIRNIKTASCKAIVPLIQSANRKILLSGTPSLSRPVELFPQIDAICPGKFGSWWSYTARYCDAKIEYIGKIRKRSVDGASNLEELQKKLSSTLMIRRCKDQVLTQLPPKQRQRVLFNLKDCELKKEIKRLFDELKPFLKKHGSRLSNSENNSADLMVLSTIQKLYQMSGDAKIGPARDYVDMLCDNQNLKFLVFAYHHAMMNGIQQTLMDRNIKFIRIDGATKPSERQAYVQQFQCDPDTRVAILSILAAGVGLTFTKATLVVFAEMYWTPGVLVQCEDRAHRIGQTSSVSVHYLVAKDTMDEWVWSAVCKKTIVTSTTLNGRKQKLKAEGGDKYQVDVLSNAESYVPSSEEFNNSQDFAAMFASQQPRDQTSILDFIGNGKKRKKSDECSPKQRKKSLLEVVSISDESEEDISEGNSHMNQINGEKSKHVSSSSEASNGIFTPKQKSNPFIMKKTSFSDSKLSFMKRKKSHSENLWYTPNKSVKHDSDIDYIDRKDDLNEFSSKTNSVRNRNVKSNKVKACRSARLKSEKMQWNCSLCTFLNHGDLPHCEMCNTSKDKAVNLKDISWKDQEVESSKEGVRIMESKSENSLERVSVTTQNTKIISGKDQNQSKSPQNVDKIHVLSNNGVQLPSNKTVDNSEITGELCRKIINWSDLHEDIGNEDVLPSLVKRTKSVRNSFQLSVEKVKSVTEDDTSECFDDSDDLSCDTAGEMCEQNRSHQAYTELSRKPSKTNPFQGSDISCHSTSESEMESLLEYESSAPYMKEVKVISSEESSYSPVSQQKQATYSAKSDLSKEAEVVFDDLLESEAVLEDKLSDSAEGAADNVRVADLDKVPVYKAFNYCLSKYTGRVYLYDQEGVSLDMNFLPLDVEIGNQENLPDVLLHPSNMRIIQKFMREWGSLTETKRRLVMKSVQMFSSPLNAYEQLRSGKTPCIQRHRTKDDITKSAVTKAEDINGTVRIIARAKTKDGDSHSKTGVTIATDLENSIGVAQAVSSEGIPLCLNCLKPYTNSLLQTSTIMSEKAAWATRFCSLLCKDKYGIQTNAQYCRDQVYEAEKGICQICKFDAHSFFRKIRDTADLKKRADLIQLSKFSSLTPKQKENIVKHPVSGHFWHVDHIKPVWEGGGQCDIDNFRTLCVICHQKVTAVQARKRATVRKLGQASGMADITAFFQPV